jgi:hypothetical protein
VSGRAPAAWYRKTALVQARQATAPGSIATLEGEMRYAAGDWLLGPGAAGEFWPCAREVFERTYERVPCPKCGDEGSYRVAGLVVDCPCPARSER